MADHDRPPTIRTHGVIRKLMTHFEEAPSPIHEGVTPTGAPVEPRVSVRDAGDQIAATTSTGSPRGATAQNPCVLPWRPNRDKPVYPVRYQPLMRLCDGVRGNLRPLSGM